MSNKKAVPAAKAALNQMKLEIANEIGLANYDTVDKGNLTGLLKENLDINTKNFIILTFILWIY